MTSNFFLLKNKKGQKIGLVKTISVLLFLFYTVTTLAGFYSCYHFMRRSELESKKERIVRNEQTLTNIENTLNNYYEQSSALYQKAAAEYSLSSYDVFEQLVAKRSILNDFVSVTALNPAIKLIFYSDTGKDIDLHNYNCTAIERISIDRLISTGQLVTGSYLESKWRYVEYDGYKYLYILNRNGNCQMGIFVNVIDIFKPCEQLILTDGEGYIVHCGDEEVLLGEYEENFLSEKNIKNKIFERDILRTDLSFAYYYQSLHKRELYDSTVIFSFGFLIIELMFCFFSYYFLRKFFVKPLNRITGVMKKVEDGDYQIRADIDKANTLEIMQLAKTFNQMLDEVVNLRMESYEQLLREQNDRLTMLRSQLRPHFYLNAINTISCMTYKEGNEEHIRDYLYSLSTHMRFMMKMNVNMVTLIDELKNVEAYIKLQEFRGECTYNYYIDCDKELEHISVPYLILYTFIDNVFKYGMKTKDSFFVMIECHKGKMEDGTPVAILSVEDNVSGFPEEYLKSCKKDENYTKEDGHIGLYNIRKTLELIYKRDDMMRIENTLTGAKVEVRIIDESINC